MVDINTGLERIKERLAVINRTKRSLSTSRASSLCASTSQTHGPPSKASGQRQSGAIYNMYSENKSVVSPGSKLSTVDLSNSKRSKSPKPQLSDILPNTGSYDTGSVIRTSSPIKRIVDYIAELDSPFPNTNSSVSEASIGTVKPTGQPEVVVTDKQQTNNNREAERQPQQTTAPKQSRPQSSSSNGSIRVSDMGDRAVVAGEGEERERDRDILTTTSEALGDRRPRSLVHGQDYSSPQLTATIQTPDGLSTPSVFISEMMDRRNDSPSRDDILEERITRSHELMDGKIKKIASDVEELKRDLDSSQRSKSQGSDRHQRVSWEEVMTKIQMAQTSRRDEPQLSTIQIGGSMTGSTGVQVSSAAAQSNELSSALMADNKKLKCENTMLKLELQRCEYNEQTVQALKNEIDRLTKLVKIRERDLSILREKYISALRGGSRFRSECSIDDHTANCDF